LKLFWRPIFSIRQQAHSHKAAGGLRGVHLLNATSKTGQKKAALERAAEREFIGRS
jgi:hypothetical protein